MVTHFNLIRNISIVLLILLVIVLACMGGMGADGDSILITLGVGLFLMLFQLLAIVGVSRLDQNMQGISLVAAPVSVGFVLGTLVFFHGLVLAELFENHLPSEVIFVIAIVGGILTWMGFAAFFIYKGPQTLRKEFLRMSLLWTGIVAVLSIGWGLIAMEYMDSRSGWFSGITGGFLVAWSGLVILWLLVPLVFTLVANHRERNGGDLDREAQLEGDSLPGEAEQPEAGRSKEAPFEQ